MQREVLDDNARFLHHAPGSLLADHRELPEWRERVEAQPRGLVRKIHELALERRFVLVQRDQYEASGW